MGDRCMPHKCRACPKCAMDATARHVESLVTGLVAPKSADELRDDLRDPAAMWRAKYEAEVVARGKAERDAEDLDEIAEVATRALERVAILRDELLSAGRLISTQGKVGLRIDAAIRGGA